MFSFHLRFLFENGSSRITFLLEHVCHSVLCLFVHFNRFEWDRSRLSKHARTALRVPLQRAKHQETGLSTNVLSRKQINIYRLAAKSYTFGTFYDLDIYIYII